MRAAIRYAKAVLNLAVENSTSEALAGEMQDIAATVEGDRQLKEVLGNPVVKGSEKEKALKAIFSGASPLTHQLIALLVRNKRPALLPAVARHYIRLYNEREGIAEAVVTTASPMDAQMERKVLEKVKDMAKTPKVTLTYHTDPDIIGGFVLRVGDVQYDASVANSFRKLKKEFQLN